MASGCDKSPGPQNDYATKPWTKLQSILLVVAVVGLSRAWDCSDSGSLIVRSGGRSSGWRLGLPARLAGELGVVTN